MKVQGINNQNSISHKAYFMPNAEFKKLWAVRPKNSGNYIENLQKVKSVLPNHEIEIIESGKTLFDEKMKDYYLLFNNITKKAFGVMIAATSVRNHLETVLECLLEKNERTENFFMSDLDTVNFIQITREKFMIDKFL